MWSHTVFNTLCGVNFTNNLLELTDLKHLYNNQYYVSLYCLFQLSYIRCLFPHEINNVLDITVGTL